MVGLKGWAIIAARFSETVILLGRLKVGRGAVPHGDVNLADESPVQGVYCCVAGWLQHPV